MSFHVESVRDSSGIRIERIFIKGLKITYCFPNKILLLNKFVIMRIILLIKN